MPSHDGAFWAPELLGPDTLVYSVSEGFADGTASCTGLARRLDGVWRDDGSPLICSFASPGAEEISTIDPSVFVAGDGTPYLVLGGGRIYGTTLDPATLRPVSGDWFVPGHPAWTTLALPPIQGHDWVEAAYVHPHDEWYYLSTMRIATVFQWWAKSPSNGETGGL